MTSTPSLPAQIEPSLDVLIGWLQSFKAPHDTRYTNALLVTLQQHERLEAEYVRLSETAGEDYAVGVQAGMKLALRGAMSEEINTRPGCGEIVERVATAMWEHNHDGAWPDDAEPVALNIYRGDAAIAINVICRALLVPQPGCVNPGPLPNADTASDNPEDAERGLRRDG